MSKRLTTLIMRALVVAALVLTGSGVQAGQVVPWESVDIPEHSSDIASAMERACGISAETHAESSNGGNADGGCQMDTEDCRSTCGNGLATNDYTISISSVVAQVPVSHGALAVIATQYPFDHPPKPLSSL